MPITAELACSQQIDTQSAPPTLGWTVHLAKRQPKRLPGIAATCLLGATCVWLIFHSALPVIAAVALLLLSITDFLFPIRFIISSEEVQRFGLTSRAAIRWRDVRRVVPLCNGLLLSPLATSSRLDPFRGVELRFAPPGEIGDRKSVESWIEQNSPDCGAVMASGGRRRAEGS